MNVDVVEASDSRWMNYLTNLDHDVYHLPAYIAAEDMAKGSCTKLFVVSQGRNKLAVPLMLNPIPQSLDLQDAMSPYGYPAPVCTVGNRDPWINDAVTHLLGHLREMKIVSVFLRLHPFMGVSAADLSRYGTRVDHGPTVSIRLDRPFESIRDDMRKSHRYEIRKALREGQRPELDLRWAYFEDFLKIYSDTMDRLGASRSYYFSREYFTQLRDQLSEHISLWVTKINDEVAAASLITECNGVVQYHLSGTHPNFHRQYPTKVLLDGVANWANERGNRRFHLGGGLGGNEDSLFQFKSGFSKDRHTFSTVRIVTMPQQYDLLVARKEAESGVISDAGSDFFPAYRKPY